MTLLSRILLWMSGSSENQQPLQTESNVPDELAAKEKIRKAVEFIESKRVCENAAFLINEYLQHELGDYTLTKIGGSQPEAKKLAPKDWLKVDSVVRLQTRDGKLLEMVIMELNNWADFSRDDSQFGDFFIRYEGELVLECHCTRSVIDMGGTRAVCIDCNTSCLHSFSNGEWVGLLSSAVLQGRKLQQKWNEEAVKAKTDELLGRADRIRL